jgi:uncharacterized protein (DUF2141 family)
MKWIVLVVVAFMSQSVYPQNFDLTITVADIRSNKGEIQIGLYNNKESFPLVDKQYKFIIIEVNKFSGSYMIKNLPEGDYAVGILHDENSDKICNKNFLGIPKEGYGFSKNFRPKLSAPKFEDCKFELKENLAITIKLIY